MKIWNFLKINEMDNDEVKEAKEENYRYGKFIEVSELLKIIDKHECICTGLDDLKDYIKNKKT